MLTVSFISLLAFNLYGAEVAVPRDVQEQVIASLESPPLPDSVRLNNTQVDFVRSGTTTALEISFAKVEWPNIFFSATEGAWDWSRYLGIAVDMFNPEHAPFPVCMRIDNDGADGMHNCLTHTTVALPKQWLTMKVTFARDAHPFWGMRGIPVWGPLPAGKPIDLSKIVAFQIFLPRPDSPRKLLIKNIRLFGYQKHDIEELVSFPFVDKFGQYKHEDWPGKVHSEKELIAKVRAEERTLKKIIYRKDYDTFGGWTRGPKRPATGWFHTERIDDKWWLITPEGNPFFSIGVDCVGTWERTFVDQRKDWFEWLPPRDEPSIFSKLYQFMQNPHSMAEPVKEGGWTFNFYNANLIRIDGEQWPTAWRNRTYRRLLNWGFNTLGAWTQEDVLENSPIPFTAITGLYGEVPRIAAGTGYWSKMYDVYDPAFVERVDSCVTPLVKKFANNPKCIGFFVDNELGWDDPRLHTLACPPSQPCRKVLIKQLQAKYETPGNLAKAWDIPETDWDELRLPSHPNTAYQEDMAEYVYGFAHTYFDTIRKVIKKHAPHQLYLGCRFAGKPETSVLRACADVVDVVSVNLYVYTIDRASWEEANDCGKPVIIGEFHFGARDRGMFHEGLCPTPDQKTRAEAYANYVKSVASSPAFVGCHWFQYVDEPITGRWFDGENYNIGLVTVTDTPYKELTSKARQTNLSLIEYRWQKR